MPKKQNFDPVSVKRFGWIKDRLNPITWIDGLIALGVTLFALIVYVYTLTPSLSYVSPDGSELATVPYVLGLAHSPGYPLYTWLGFLFSRLLPFADVAFRINLMSAVMGAMGVGVLYLIIIQILPANYSSNSTTEMTNLGRAIAALCALLFAFSVDFWSQALIAEVYAPNLAMIALSILALMFWDRNKLPKVYFLFALIFGLSLGTHLSDLGFAPAFALFTGVSILNQYESWRDRFKNIFTHTLIGFVGFAIGVAQYLWLPLRANTLNDRFMLRFAPTSLKGIYNYTLGAFSNLKFAYPLIAIPDRLVIYLDMLRQQFGLLGFTLGIVGLFALLFRRPRYFHLLVWMYLIHVWFFIQYSVFDLEVFFIPVHFIWAIFIAFGLETIFSGMAILSRKLKPGVKQVGVFSGVILPAMLVAFSLIPLTKNWSTNDLSDDTAINDFYANVWDLLPQEAAFITPGGVLGYDAFYWQVIYDTREDVLLPTLPTPNPEAAQIKGRDTYATLLALMRRNGPGALPRDLLEEGLWGVPVLVGEQPGGLLSRSLPLMLIHLTDEPPELTVDEPNPQITINADFGSVILIGVDLYPTTVESGGYIELALYWQSASRQPGAIPRLRVETLLGERTLEQHEIGFSQLERYALEVGLTAEDVIVEKYAIVIPSTVAPGKWTLNIRSVDFGDDPGSIVQLSEVNVVDEIDTFERWFASANQ